MNNNNLALTHFFLWLLYKWLSILIYTILKWLSFKFGSTKLQKILTACSGCRLGYTSKILVYVEIPKKFDFQSQKKGKF